MSDLTPTLVVDASPATVCELKALLCDLPNDMVLSDWSGELVNVRVYECEGQRYVEVL